MQSEVLPNPRQRTPSRIFTWFALHRTLMGFRHSNTMHPCCASPVPKCKRGLFEHSFYLPSSYFLSTQKHANDSACPFRQQPLSVRKYRRSFCLGPSLQFDRRRRFWDCMQVLSPISPQVDTDREELALW